MAKKLTSGHPARKGPPAIRPDGAPKVLAFIRLKPATAEKIDALAEAEGRTRAAQISRVLDLWAMGRKDG